MSIVIVAKRGWRLLKVLRTVDRFPGLIIWNVIAVFINFFLAVRAYAHVLHEEAKSAATDSQSHL
jgi:hypothetical protein